MDPDKLSQIRQSIESRGGVFGTIYREITISNGKNLKRWFVEYTCDQGHHNKKRVDTMNKAWCYECTKGTINDAHRLAEKLGWKFLSDTYINANTKYRWQCNRGHIIEAKYGNVYAGKGCKKCQMHSLDDLKKKAQEHGGECLSTKYTKILDRYRFRCKNGHEWEAFGSSILAGTWCAECNVTINERTCRKIMEFIYKRPFDKQRPDWLTTDKGGRLELDCYNEELKIALEYNGKQHYEMVPYFYKTQKAFEDCQQADRDKERLCRDNNIHLIVVPYTVQYQELYRYIRKRCRDISPGTPEDIDYSVLNLSEYNSEKIEEIQKFINEKYGGGEILSKYVNNYTDIKFRCTNGHEFDQSWATVKSGSFCKECTYSRKRESETLPKIKEYCQQHDITMIGEYRKAKTRTEWKCNKCDEQFTKTWDSLRVHPHKCS